MTYVARVWFTGFNGGEALKAERLFKSPTAAYVWVRVKAWWIDLNTPRGYWSTYQDGTPLWCEHEFGIDWGIKTETEDELKEAGLL